MRYLYIIMFTVIGFGIWTMHQLQESIDNYDENES